MPITTKPPFIGAGLNLDRALLGLLQSIIDRIEKPRIEEVANVTGTISDPPTQAEVLAIGNKVNELLQALRDANMLEDS